jgi:hypothetical protein
VERQGQDGHIENDIDHCARNPKGIEIETTTLCFTCPGGPDVRHRYTVETNSEEKGEEISDHYSYHDVYRISKAEIRENIEIEIKEGHLDRGNRADIEYLDDLIVLEKIVSSRNRC